jgi:hypothetical protein
MGLGLQLTPAQEALQVGMPAPECLPLRLGEAKNGERYVPTGQ